jgi:CheY-like chemotaxis protein/two-component sensor histidine kinase
LRSDSKDTNDGATRAFERELAAANEARERAEEANRRKDAFLAILSHEMRSPLNSVLTWVQVLRSDALPPETRRQALDSIERSAKVQTRMIEDLLDNSRILSGKLSLELQGTDLISIVRGAVDVAAVAAREKRVDLVCTLDFEERVPIRADPVRLQQVIGNLLSNAIKFTPAGGRVRVEAVCNERSAEISVCDTGCGIAPEILPHVFDSFRQGDSSITRRHSGLGLGLSIARHLVELHGGTIAASSDGKDSGATFTVRLPLFVPISPPLDSEREMGSPATVLRGLEVLVVDDDADSAHALELVLTAAGSVVRKAESTAQALRLWEARPCAIIISDLAMPEQDGYALLRVLRERNVIVPVIAFTASASAEDRDRALRAGFSLHLAKPVDPAELLDAVAMAVTGRSADFTRARVEIAS